MHAIIEVTQNDIEGGVKGQPSQCAIAKAIARFIQCTPEFRMYERPEVSCNSITMLHKVDKDIYIEAECPDIAAAFIRRFDRMEYVAPIRFQLHFSQKRVSNSPCYRRHKYIVWDSKSEPLYMPHQKQKAFYEGSWNHEPTPIEKQAQEQLAQMIKAIDWGKTVSFDVETVPTVKEMKENELELVGA